ncbi:MAG: CDGSH iron-sulfur domain-containing protein [Spirochaetia bacterium]|nr:CDGSH iron-sulfur domain-containing protein [Spirochaetia bacterium]
MFIKLDLFEKYWRHCGESKRMPFCDGKHKEL